MTLTLAGKVRSGEASCRQYFCSTKYGVVQLLPLLLLMTGMVGSYLTGLRVVVVVFVWFMCEGVCVDAVTIAVAIAVVVVIATMVVVDVVVVEHG